MRGFAWLSAAAVAVLALAAGCAQPAAGPQQASAPSAAEDQGPADSALLPGLLDAQVGSTRVSDGAEPMIVADRNGRFLWIGDTGGVFVSSDNGTSWREMPTYTGDVGLVFGDGVALAQDGKGRLYGAFLHDNRGDVARSDDGLAFTQAALAAGAPVDRPWVAAHGDEVMLVFLNNFGAIGLLEGCARSTDAGATFLDRNPAAGPAGSGGIVVDDAGTYYVAYSGDGSLTRLTTCASSVWPVMDSKVMFADGVGANNQIQVATDGTALHVAAAGPGNVIQLSSARSWTDPPRVLGLSSPSGTATFAAVAARGDDVAVAWYGSTTPGDPSAAGFTGDFHVYLAIVRDPFGDQGGPFVSTVRLTEQPNHHGQICMAGVTCTGNRGLLDYFGVALDVWGGAHVAYVDDTGAAGTYYVHVLPSGLPAPAPTAPPVVVEPPPANDGQTPVASFDHETRGFRVEVDASASRDPQGSALAYAWEWGDGSTGSGRLANHTYARYGAFAVTLRVTDPEGNVGVATENLLVDGTANAAPRARMSVSPERPYAGQTVRFTDVSTDADGTVVARAWDFGAVGTSDKREVTAAFPAGNYTVRLKVVDDAGASATVSAPLQVLPAPASGVPSGGSGPVQVEVPAAGLAPLALALLALAAAGRRTRTRRP